MLGTTQNTFRFCRDWSGMENTEVTKNVGCLTDLELVILLSAVAKEHCIIETLESHVDRLITELHLVRTWQLPGGALTKLKR